MTYEAMKWLIKMIVSMLLYEGKTNFGEASTYGAATVAS